MGDDVKFWGRAGMFSLMANMLLTLCALLIAYKGQEEKMKKKEEIVSQKLVLLTYLGNGGNSL
jgi:hypothetical protein